MKKGETIFTMGNDAMTSGAIAAGARFYAGYPITPSSEVAELSSVRLPKVGGIYVQMEDELGSMAAIIGASVAGKKAYTATSGPGFSLMQENLGVAVMGEVPCVIINVMRSGPSTGLATKPAQGDLFQAKWGTHGDHGIIAISPSSVQECYDYMITAFNLAEKYRTPVIFLADEIVGHMRESYLKWDVTEADIVNRKKPDCVPEDYRVYDFAGEPDAIAPLASYGSEYVFRINGSMHDETGAPCSSPENAATFIRHYMEKFENNKDDITIVNQFMMDDAEYAIISFGCSVRPAKAAMKIAREKGLNVGVVQLVTVWPFADAIVEQVCSRVKGVVVPEMNLGQLIGEIHRVSQKDLPIVGVNKVNSDIITPNEILNALREMIK
jgi:2-oxoglutarate ferredoxin oxidoreductase subunit alpha